jgi:hypothetical protein
MSFERQFTRHPHPHVRLRRLGGPVSVQSAHKDFHGSHLPGRFNAWLGLRITLVVGTMWAAYLFTFLALISAPSAFASANPIVIVAWVAQTFLQLVLLPIIIVGQNVQSKAADARAEATFKDVEALLHGQEQIHDHLDHVHKDVLRSMGKNRDP